MRAAGAVWSRCRILYTPRVRVRRTTAHASPRLTGPFAKIALLTSCTLRVQPLTEVAMGGRPGRVAFCAAPCRAASWVVVVRGGLFRSTPCIAHWDLHWRRGAAACCSAKFHLEDRRPWASGVADTNQARPSRDRSLTALGAPLAAEFADRRLIIDRIRPAALAGRAFGSHRAVGQAGAQTSGLQPARLVIPTWCRGAPAPR
jgi:hypothetical protein